jgi:hypothetical protein
MEFMSNDGRDNSVTSVVNSLQKIIEYFIYFYNYILMARKVPAVIRIPMFGSMDIRVANTK